MKLSQIGEFGFIHKISTLSPKSRKVVVGIGDDAAVVVPSKNKNHLVLLTCDPVIEGIHFNSSATPYQIGWKAMARNLSDIAAMGGTPLYALVAASLPPSLPLSKAMGIHRGIISAAKKFGVSVIGGDTSHNPHQLHITITLIGEIAATELVTRSGARVGDAVCITGNLGGSIYGKHLKFEPRICEARFLAQQFHPSSMMDISDGLASDLQRLAEGSDVGFEIWENTIPISQALRSRSLTHQQQIQHAIQDGEDYELIFTISPKHLKSLQIEWEKRFRLRLTHIGTVRSKRFGIRLAKREGGQHARIFPRPMNDHFGK